MTTCLPVLPLFLLFVSSHASNSNFSLVKLCPAELKWWKYSETITSLSLSLSLPVLFSLVSLFECYANWVAKVNRRTIEQTDDDDNEEREHHKRLPILCRKWSLQYRTIAQTSNRQQMRNFRPPLKIFTSFIREKLCALRVVYYSYYLAFHEHKISCLKLGYNMSLLWSH